MTTYSELVKSFRAKNSKPKTGWKYESWADPKVERLAVFTKPQFGTQDTYGAPEEIPIIPQLAILSKGTSLSE